MKTKRLTDEELAERAAEYRRLRAEEKASAALAESHRDVILAELSARKALSVVVGGHQVTAKANRRTSYDADAAKAVLKPAQYRKITKVTVLHQNVEAHLKAGDLTEEEVEAFRTVELSSPYLVVTVAAAA
jgi:hypothetical protein